MSSVIGDIFGAGGVSSLLSNAMDKIWPDPAKAAAAKAALIQAEQAGALEDMKQQVQLQVEQIKVNAVEAASPKVFIAGWRPFVGWVAGVSLGLVYIPKAIALCGIWIYQAIVIVHGWDSHAALVLPPYPDLGVTDLLGLLGSLLGFGTLRTLDKRAGTDNGH